MVAEKGEKASQGAVKAILFLVPTPIGNLKDITLRALEVLREVDLIACEDTRHTRKLLSAYGIHTPLVSYEKFSEKKKASRIAEELAEGRSVALVSDAGTPLISDPGSVLIRKARDMGVRIETLPGPSAVTAAVSASGYEGAFRFMGFFPRQKSAAVREVMRMKLSSDHTVFYESPRRIIATLKLLDEHLGDRPVFLAREISKMHEEHLFGTAGDVLRQLSLRREIGEVTVVVRGAAQESAVDEDVLRKRARQLMDQAYSKKDILRVLVEETGLRRNRIYEILQDLG
jgi:16S rRNA (cytidine1402-2'-O)-methyltransferase